MYEIQSNSQENLPPVSDFSKGSKHLSGPIDLVVGESSTGGVGRSAPNDIWMQGNIKTTYQVDIQFGSSLIYVILKAPMPSKH